MKEYKTKYKIGDKVKLINNQVVTIVDIDNDDIDEGKYDEYCKGLYNLNYEVQFSNYNVIWTTLPNIKGLVLDALTEEEITYISNIVKPLKKDSRIADIFIEKNISVPYTREHIALLLYDEDSNFITAIRFPSFEQGKYYKGLVSLKSYNLKELGI